MKCQSVVKKVCAGIVGLAVCAATGALADDYGETVVRTTAEGLRSVTVSFADLDLDSADGREVLHYRVQNAARRVCGPDDYRIAGSLRRAEQNRQCRDDAVGAALAGLGTSQVAVVGR